MKLEKIRDEYHFYTGKASELARQLAFAGIAIIWIFRVDRSFGPALPPSLIWPGVLLTITLLLDFLQYSYAALAYWRAYCVRETQKKRDNLHDEIDYGVSVWMLYPMDALFVLKLIAVAVAYVLLTIDLFHRLYV